MRKALYTINFNRYDNLHHPKLITPGWDYIVFSDRDLKTNTFEVRKVKTKLPGNLAARDYYINSQKYLPEYDLTVMIGGQLQANMNLDAFLKKCDLTKDFNMMNHGRGCTYKEAHENKNFFGEKGKNMIDLQMANYWCDRFPANFGLFAHGVIVRGRNKNIAKHERLWWQEVKNPEYVTRDQLSFMYILWKHKLITTNIFGEYWKVVHSDFSIFKHGTDQQL